MLLKEISGVPIPDAINELHLAEIRHNKVCDTDKMRAEVEEILKII
jgi:threonine synthase